MESQDAKLDAASKMVHNLSHAVLIEARLRIFSAAHQISSIIH